MPESLNRSRRSNSRRRTGRGAGRREDASRNGGTATSEGKPSKAEPRERHQHETRLEGLRAEQDVKRLRKPEGVAEPGEVNLAIRRHQRKQWCQAEVAARSLMRCRGANLMRGPLDATFSVTETAGRASGEEGVATNIDLGRWRGSHSSSSTGSTAWEDVHSGKLDGQDSSRRTAQDRVSTISSEVDTLRFKARAGVSNH
jgi:hypothetical protein